MNVNFRELVYEFPKEFERRNTRQDWDIVESLKDIGSPADYYLDKEVLNHLRQGETTTVRGYFFVELGNKHTPIVVWCDVICQDFDEETGTFEGEYSTNNLGWDYYFEVQKLADSFLRPQADYLEFMK